MYSDRVRRRIVWIVVAAAIIIAACAVTFFAVNDPARDMKDESAVAIREAVLRSATQCYVVEGVYPPGLDYLVNNYGLHINTGDFYVTYEAFASNLPPTVIVTAKK